MNEKLDWKRLASLKAGGAICLPVILAGHALCQKYGLPSALLAIGVGNAVLLAMGLVMSKMSMEAKKTTTDNALTYFGERGTYGFAGALLFAKTCWVAIQLNLMVISIQALLPEGFSRILLSIPLGLMVILVAMRGISALTLVTSLSIPLLVSTMAYALYGVYGNVPAVPLLPISLEGISVAIATAVTAVIDMPTYFRHATSKRDSALATLVFLGIAVPLIEGVGIALYYFHPGSTVLDTLRLDGSPVWNVWVTLFLVLAGWSTNNSNLYSASACLGTILPKLEEKKRTLMIGLVAITLCMLGILDYFTSVLQMIGVMTGSMGATIVVCYLMGRIASFTLNLLAWGLGVIVGIGSIFHVITITGIPLIDACAVAAGATLLTQLYKMPTVETT